MQGPKLQSSRDAQYSKFSRCPAFYSWMLRKEPISTTTRLSRRFTGHDQIAKIKWDTHFKDSQKENGQFQTQLKEFEELKPFP